MTPAETDSITALTPSAYATTEQLFATKYRQGGRTVFQLALSPEQIITLIKRPDPEIGNPDNRRIRESHARGFADYFMTNPDWVVPGVIFRAPNMFEFNELQAAPDVDFGIISFPKRNADNIRIVDGQHRTLGFFMVPDLIEEKLGKLRDSKARARRAQDDKTASDIDREIREWEKVKDRFYKERVSVEIQVTDSPKAAKQMFSDIADNALGITASVRARFDTRKKINRALEPVLNHPLLEGRVEMNLDRVQGNSPLFLSARQVIEIMRVLSVGFDGRIGVRVEAELEEGEIIQKSREFFDMLVDTFPPIHALTNNLATAPGLRSSMLLGNALFLRVLAGVLYELRTKSQWAMKDVQEFFTQLAPHTTGRAHENSIWQIYAPETAFAPNALGPNGRRADSLALVHTIANWARLREPFVAAAPLPAPEAPAPDPDDEIDFALGHDTKALQVEERNAIEAIAAESKRRSRPRVEDRG